MFTAQQILKLLTIAAAFIAAISGGESFARQFPAAWLAGVVGSVALSTLLGSVRSRAFAVVAIPALLTSGFTLGLLLGGLPPSADAASSLARLLSYCLFVVGGFLFPFIGSAAVSSWIRGEFRDDYLWGFATLAIGVFLLATQVALAVWVRNRGGVIVLAPIVNLILIILIGREALSRLLVFQARSHSTTTPLRVTKSLAEIGAADLFGEVITVEQPPRTCHVVSTAWQRPRLVISSELLDALDSAELNAILKHEAAHVRLRHFRRGTLGLTAIVVGTVLFSISLLLVLRFLLQGRGDWIPAAAIAAIVVVPRYLYGLFLTRRFEREADAFAAADGSGPALVSSLEKLMALGGNPTEASNAPGLWTTHDTWQHRRERLLGNRE